MNVNVKDVYEIIANDFDDTRKAQWDWIEEFLNQFPKLKVYSIKSGTKVFDWKIPSEWNIKYAYVLDKNNKKIIDFNENNLHVVNYSIPTNKILNKKELLSRLHTIKKLPSAIPYVTSYYKKYWGFCCSFYYKKKIQKNYNN